MLNRSASLAMSTSVLKALPGKLYIKRHSPCILYILKTRSNFTAFSMEINGLSVFFRADGNIYQMILPHTLGTGLNESLLKIK